MRLRKEFPPFLKGGLRGVLILCLLCFIFQNSLAETFDKFTISMIPKMSQGMHSPYILELQKILNANGYDISATGPGSPGNETDLYDTKVTKAVVQFQIDNEIAVSGKINQETIKVLNEFVDFQNENSKNDNQFLGDDEGIDKYTNNNNGVNYIVNAAQYYLNLAGFQTNSNKQNSSTNKTRKFTIIDCFLNFACANQK